MIIITIIIIVFIIIIIIAIINIIIIFMVPFYEKRRVYVIQLSCGCCLTFNIGGGCFTKVVRLHIYIGGSIILESPRLLLNYFFPLEPNQSPTNNVVPRLIAVVSVTKAHVSTRLVWSMFSGSHWDAGFLGEN